ncbi:MAG: RNA polymerase sigma factor [Acidobacteria bacterium]|nr:RNA polymerase sigma factor [Acidobacteriota bacterium]
MEMDDAPRIPGFADLYREHARAVYRFALALAGEVGLAEDLTAEAFLRIWQAGERVRLATVRAYLLAIVRNLYLHELRHLKRRVELVDNLPCRAVDHEINDELRQVLASLQQLPETDRAALLLRAEHGLPYEEIAAVLGLTVSTAKVKVHRARLRLNEIRMRRSP